MCLPRTLIAYICIAGLSVSCSGPPPEIIEAKLPTQTDDLSGPYVVSVETWGDVSQISLKWRLDDMDDSEANVTTLRQVRPNHWSGEMPGVGRSAAVHMTLTAKGPGGKSRFPSLGEHTFLVGNPQDGCRPECADGFDCILSQCTPTTECSETRPCPEGAVCLEGLCMPRSGCTPACAEGEICIDDVCQRPPPCTDECDENTRCQMETGRCVECLDDNDCPSPLRCNLDSNTCVECLENDGCPNQGVCVEGLCQETACGQDEYEPNNDENQSHVFESAASINGLLCPSDTDFFRYQRLDGVLKVTRLDRAGLLVIRDIQTGLETNIEGGETVSLSSDGFALTTTSERVPYELEIVDEPIVCEGDPLEPDNSPETATTIGASGARIAARICVDDRDWFEVRQRRRDREGRVLLKTRAERLEAQLLQQNDDFQASVAFGRSLANPWVSLEYPDLSENLLTSVRCVDCGESGADYWIATRTEQGGRCEDDEFEPNDDREAALPLPPNSNFIGPPMVVCGASDDWFSIEKDARTELRIQFEFDSFQGDIDVLLYDQDATLLDYQIDGSSGHELVIPQNFSAGTYWIRTVLFGNGQNNYLLRVTTR